MKVIIIGCAGGATSSLLCETIRKAGKKRNIFIKHDYLFEYKILETIEEAKNRGVEILLMYCGVGDLNNQLFEKIGDYIDCIYVAPQARYLIPKVNKALDGRKTICKAIDMRVFGLMDGEKMLEDILMF